jgi:NADPH-dependent 7-cyano-7-deazaguanine reductase QueF
MIKTQPNERRCHHTEEEHRLDLPECCPISKNPRPGSSITIQYAPVDLFLEVASLKAYIDSYQGGRGDVRSMEGMIQAIAQDCADTVRARVTARADLVIEPSQRMVVTCQASPRRAV